MIVSESVLKRYALAYIKKSGSNNNVQEFLQHCNNARNLTWSEENFDKKYEEFISANRDNTRNINNQYNAGNNVGSQTTYIHVHNKGFDFWDFLLLQCCINSLFGGRSHTTVINHNYGTPSGAVDKSEDRKLLALGIAVTAVCVAFHGLMCYFYYSSKKEARKSEKIDYLDNKLKTFRNIEFAVSAISLAALVACVFYPVLPMWGLAVLGVNSLVCFAGGLAFQMKHDKESEDIEKAETAVKGCIASGYVESPPYCLFR
ncbi:hypothetical protein [Wolbachia endosymbiont of Ctenocephalides felis wCfeJ]|uniref:hypothetical protein n=1 Tax=Wolbachia endosymbiont of Ctenocephalides felis wCfeJ TaxID=2732594 RepID=UPI001583D5E7|nr:hypothetical protein [Wolbachia endosymbiont of Ctenocephalides felis wCfeJ]WCR57591.1 MAG: hypothetical protein PG980_000063 [Wolbachia endosymbiont of Ctenocephalides felis wCfeJ]